MARGWIHTTKQGLYWVNTLEGSSQALDRHVTKADAVAAGRRVAMDRKTEHLIHNEDGTISERNSYGNDPYPPRG